MNPHNVMIRASEILMARGLKPELSPQARAVVEALCESISVELEQGVTKAKGAMARPTMSEVVLHGAKTALPTEQCMAFYDYYEANGWKVGRNPMKQWTPAMANWKRTWLANNPRFQATSEISYRDVKNECREKYGDQMEWMTWASQFFNFWARKKWMRNGAVIDWKVELSAQVARWRRPT